MSGVEFRAVTKRYGEVLAVDDISFEILPGTLATVVGPSGCGKTTTLRMLAGLEAPTAGRLLIGGRDVTLLSPAERNVSLVFQSYALFPHMSVLENVAYGPSVQGASKGDAAARARTALAGVGLDGYEARLPAELSGGQQQRVALARALVLEPEVLLFDEPLSNLDARLRRRVREDIRDLQQRLGLTVLYVTHDREEALAVSDTVVVMDRGRIVEKGAPAALYDAPRTAFVAGFLGEANLADVTIERIEGNVARITLAGLLLSLPARGARPGTAKLAVRPDAVRFDAASALKVRVVHCAHVGRFYEYELSTPFGTWFVVQPGHETALAPGAESGLALHSRGVCLVETG
jgi:iron(III) transport system ATP-binding protein